MRGDLALGVLLRPEATGVDTIRKVAESVPDAGTGHELMHSAMEAREFPTVPELPRRTPRTIRKEPHKTLLAALYYGGNCRKISITHPSELLTTICVG